MKTYELTVVKTILLMNNVQIECADDEDPEVRFQHLLEAKDCPGLEDADGWGEAYYYGVVKADPYDFEYEVVNVEEVKE